jgi:deoxyribodipyrimidine photolyase-related protein
MSTLRLVLGDQLTRGISCLDGIDAKTDVVLMAEVSEEARYVRHHKQKLVLLFAAMRHFAQTLRDEGLRVDYIALDDPLNTGSFSGELERARQRHGCSRVVLTEPGEWRVLEMMTDWQKHFEVPVEIRPDDRFLCSLDEFKKWADGRKALRMEYFYREMRRKTGWLMAQGKPEGGRWNFDAQNRKSLPADQALPERLRFEADDVTREVMDQVGQRFPEHFGDIEPFGWPVTRRQAVETMHHFIADCLPNFGDYQDAMKAGEGFLFHSLLSSSLNIGLLTPTEVCQAALAAYRAGQAPLAAVEGFVRQILGWREFIRGLYWMLMPDYPQSNYLSANRPLPDFYWSGDTELNCLGDAIETTRKHAYAHHIQRLMITGNFALLAGINPAEVEQWYLLVYADAFEWVELPNTHGMALFADGGVLASKPYAASGAYINRMSDYCKGCKFNPKTRQGPEACPFNFLYWNFLIGNEPQLRGNPRMGLAYRNLDRIPPEQRSAITRQSRQFLDGLSTTRKGSAEPGDGP